MQLFKAISNDTIYDVCLNCYGTLDLLVKLMVDNNFGSINNYPVNEQEFKFDEALVATKVIKDINIIYATK